MDRWELSAIFSNNWAEHIEYPENLIVPRPQQEAPQKHLPDNMWAVAYP